jgi:hypothetical protein
MSSRYDVDTPHSHGMSEQAAAAATVQYLDSASAAAAVHAHDLYEPGQDTHEYLDDDYDEQPDDYEDEGNNHSHFLTHDDPRMSHELLTRHLNPHLIGGPLSATSNYAPIRSESAAAAAHMYSDAQMNRMRLGIKPEPENGRDRQPLVLRDGVEEMSHGAKRPTQTASEKKRRDQIKSGYEKLAHICGGGGPVKPCSKNGEGGKMSHATILNNTVDYISSLEYEIKSLKDEYKQMEMQITSVEMMKQAYSVMSCTAEAPAAVGGVSQNQAFLIFRHIADMLYESFRHYLRLNSFRQMTETMLKWAEVYCNPGAMHRAAEVEMLKLKPDVLSYDIPPEHHEDHVMIN